MSNDLSWVADLLNGVKEVRVGGNPLPARGAINLGAGLSATDNPTTGATDLVSSSVVPNFVNALASFAPSATRQSVNLDGFSSSGDGGGGLFVWNNSDTRADDGGTIIKVTSLATGRWNRVYHGTISVKWFGAVGDDSTPDDAAIQRAFDAAAIYTAAIPNTVYQSGQLQSVWVFFPFGKYNITAELSLKGGIGLAGDPYTLLVTSSTSISILRTALANNNIRHLAFSGGKHHITAYGHSAHYGVALGSEQGAYPSVIDWCSFKGATGPSFYVDNTPISGGGSFTNGIPNTAASITFDHCELNGPCTYYGCCDSVTYRRCYAVYDLTTGAFDDNGNVLAFWSSSDHIVIEDCVGIPGDTVPRKGAWLGGSGVFKTNRFRFGGESATISMFRSRKIMPYNSMAAGLGWSNPSEFYFEQCETTGSGAVAWGEVYDEFPRVISIGSGMGTNPYGNINGGAEMPGTFGLAVDLTTCPVSSFVNRDVRGLQILFTDGVGDTNKIRIYGGTTMSQDPSGFIDLGPHLRKHVNPHLPTPERQTPQNNLFLVNVVRISDFTPSFNGGDYGANDTSTGYTLNTCLASADGGNLALTASSDWNGNAGEYAFSFAVKSTYGGILTLGYQVDASAWASATAYTAHTSYVYGNAGGVSYIWEAVATTGDNKSGGGAPTWTAGLGSTVVDNHVTWANRGPNFIACAFRTLDGSGEWERVGCNVYHDGLVPKKWYAAIYDMPNAGSVCIGLPALHSGRYVHPYTFPVDSPTSPTYNKTVEGLARSVYYGAAAPTTSGEYLVGDMMINTAPSAGGTWAWICTAGGSPGTWKAVSIAA